MYINMEKVVAVKLVPRKHVQLYGYLRKEMSISTEKFKRFIA